MTIIREFSPPDAPAVSEIVRLTMAASNASDYSIERLRPLIDYFSADKISMLNRERFCVVAELDGRIVGTAALEGDHIQTFFVHPDRQRLGIGPRLLAAIEKTAAARGLTRLFVEASLSGADFYERHDYVRTGNVIEGTAGTHIEMQKTIIR